MPESLRCPKCGCEVGEAFAARLREELRGEIEAGAAKREAALAVRESEAAKKERAFDERVRAAVEARAASAAQGARAEAQAAVALEVDALRGDLSKSRDALKEAQRQELEVRRRGEALERAKAEFELECQRRMDEERASIREKAKADSVGEQSLKLKEKDALIDSMRKQIDDLKHRSEKGSEQLHGEVLEATLEEALRREFPSDSIEPVARGTRGGDVLQRVRLADGTECGSILWELKRTRLWSPSWLPKLRDDQREIRADLAALVTQALPAGAGPVGSIESVWVSTYPCFVGLAHLLRKGLVDVATAQRRYEGRDEKMAALYAYLTGAGFRSRIEGLLEPFKTMKVELEAEKTAMQRLWAKRERQLERALRSTAGLYGDMEGIVGATLPEIEQLALPDADVEGDAAAERLPAVPRDDDAAQRESD